MEGHHTIHTKLVKDETSTQEPEGIILNDPFEHNMR